MDTTKKLKKVEFSTVSIGTKKAYNGEELTVNHAFNFSMLHSDFLEMLNKNGAKYDNTPDGLKPYLGLVIKRSTFSSKAIKNAHFLKSVEWLSTNKEAVEFSDIVKSYKSKTHKNNNSDAKNDYFYLTDLVNLVNSYNKALITEVLTLHKLEITSKVLEEFKKLQLLDVTFTTEGKYRRYSLDFMTSDNKADMYITMSVYNLVEVDEDEFEHFEMM